MAKRLHPGRVQTIDDPELLTALLYLTGTVEVGRNGVMRSSYPPEWETEGRAAVARCLLRRPPDPALCVRLSLLFDPEPNVDREIEIGFRRKGRRRDKAYDLSIAFMVFSSISEGRSVEDSVERVAEHVFLSPEAVRKIWSKEKNSFNRQQSAVNK